jgi:orotate phosphoribosyltransferase
MAFKEPLMPTPQPIIHDLARALVRVGVVRIAARQPFIYTSGWASPVYLDMHRALSDVACRGLLLEQATHALTEPVNTRGINALVGAESSGVAWGALLADRLGLPLLSLRKRPRGWDVDGQLDGQLPPDPKVLLIDDVTTDGHSKISACEALRRCGAAVNDAFVVVNYGVYPQSSALLNSAQIHLQSLLTWPDLFHACEQLGPLSPVQRQSISEFNADPVHWSLLNGGIGS